MHHTKKPINCQNCNSKLLGNYCSNCGQPADTHKINIHYLWHDIQHGLLHIDKGILFTTKELFTRPGNSIKEFIEGKRIKHFKPFSFVIVLAGIYGFLSHYFNINMLSNIYQITGSGEKFNHVKETVEKMSEWLSVHYSIVALIQIPVFTIGSYLSFRKAGYNFMEHLVIHTFLTGQRLLLHIFSFPLYYAFNNTPKLIITDRVIDVIGYLFLGWALIQFFNKMSAIQRFWKTILSLSISFFIIFLVLIGVFEAVINSIK